MPFAVLLGGLEQPTVKVSQAWSFRLKQESSQDRLRHEVGGVIALGPCSKLAGLRWQPGTLAPGIAVPWPSGSAAI